MISRTTCEFALTTANVQAFLRVIRRGETNQTPDAYRMINGGALIQDMRRHPYDGLPSPPGRATGAYQFLGTTWAGIKVQLDLYDFSPASQDLGAVGLIQGRGALEDVIAGRFDTAVAKLRKEWTSLPGASENNSAWTLEKARALYQSYGGLFAENSPVVDSVQQPPPFTEHEQRSNPMPAPLLLALAPMLAELIPQIAKLFSSGSEVSTRNVAAVEAVAKTVVTATNSANVQEAIERMQADPAVRDQVQKAVVTDPIIMGLLEVGGGVAKAREAGERMQQAEKSFLWNPLFWMSIILLPLASYVVFAAVTGGHAQAPWWVGAGVSAEAKVGIISSVISLIIGGICGIWFGTSYGSQKKDERAANQ